MKNRISILVAAALHTPLAFAGGGAEAGNGGLGHVCYGVKDATGLRTITFAEPLDYFEAKNGASWSINLGVDQPNMDDVDAMVEVGISRAESITPSIGRKLRELYPYLKSQIHPLKGANPAKTNDATLRVVPEDPNCEIAQIAYQLKNPGPKDRQFVYYDRAWAGMKDLGRAGLHLHELVYLTELAAGAENSDATREYVRLISSDDLATMPWEDIVSILRKLKQPLNVSRGNVVGELTSRNGIIAKSETEIPIKTVLNGTEIEGVFDADSTAAYDSELRLTSVEGTLKRIRIGTDEYFDVKGALNLTTVDSGAHLEYTRPSRPVQVGSMTIAPPPQGSLNLYFDLLKTKVRVEKKGFSGDTDVYRLGNGKKLEISSSDRPSINFFELYLNGSLAGINVSEKSGRFDFEIQVPGEKPFRPRGKLSHQFGFDTAGTLIFGRSVDSRYQDATTFYYEMPSSK